MKKMIATILMILITTILTAPVNVRFAIPEGEPISDASTWDNIEHEILRNDIQYPEILMIQIRLETGNLTSRIFKECNNLAGMKYPRKRKTTAIGRDKKTGMAIYDCWQSSITDYAIWQREFYKSGDYLVFLNSLYATDKYYYSKLIRLINTL